MIISIKEWINEVGMTFLITLAICTVLTTILLIGICFFSLSKEARAVSRAIGD